ncbi:kinase-like protein, partial [Trametes coccinea BRFM310]
TQQPTQSTDDGSQPAHVADDNLWGSLIPCSPILPQYKLYKSKPKYVIGRSSECDIAIASRFISSHHCSIEWDGDIGPKSSVTVTDHSRYGTFVNGNKIEKAAILRDGHEISFGTSKPRPKEGGIHDYRYIYRHLAYKPPSGGVHSVYDMQHELGKGSYATVVKALHKQEGRWYAIKIISTHKLRGNWTDDAALEGLPKTDGARRLLREITVLERLEHKNICQLKEVFVHSRNVYLVLELVPGGDLVRYLMQLEKRGRRMKEQEARHITYQICDALAYVHRHGIAHRDLKPENVLLTNDNPPVVKVADFGLAKVIDTLTMLHTICGTPIYLAPEVVLRGSDGYSQIVDSWSVGMITLIMLTMDMQPVLGVNPKADLKTQVENRRVNWELLRRNRVSEQGEDFIRSLLQDDPAKRMTLEDACTHPWLAS